MITVMLLFELLVMSLQLSAQTKIECPVSSKLCLNENEPGRSWVEKYNPTSISMTHEKSHSYNSGTTTIYYSSESESYNSNSMMVDGLPKDFLFFEIGGNGIFLSANYERMIEEKIGVRIGVGSFGYSGISFPMMLNYYLSDENKFELGIGTTPFSKFTEDSFIGESGTLLSSTIGIKLFRKTGGLLLRVSGTPFINLTEGEFHLFAGLSLGWAIK